MVALLIAAALVGLAGPGLCGAVRTVMPCCETRGDCDTGLGRPACCVDLPADGRAPATQAASAPATAQAAAPSSPVATVAAPPSPVATVLLHVPLASDSPPLHLLHSVFLC